MSATVNASSAYKGYDLTIKNPQKLVKVLNNRGFFLDGKEKKYTINVSITDTIPGKIPAGVKTIILTKPVYLTASSADFSFYLTPAQITDPTLNQQFMKTFFITAYNSRTRISEPLIYQELTKSIAEMGNDGFVITKK